MLIIKPGYSLRDIMDTHLVVGKGRAAFMPNCIMAVNETGEFLWNRLQEGAEQTELVSALLDEFDVDEETAAKDVEAFLSQLRAKGLVTEC